MQTFTSNQKVGNKALIEGNVVNITTSNSKAGETLMGGSFAIGHSFNFEETMEFFVNYDGGIAKRTYQ